MKDIHKVVLYTFIFAVLPIIAFLLITSRTSLLFGIRTFVVMTGSMRPAIGVDSLVFTTPSSEYNIGDVITFPRGNITITHRIISIKNNQFEVKGDANNAPDPILVSKSTVIGKTLFIIPYLGKITSFIKTIPGFILLIVIPTLSFIFFEAKTIKEEWEKEIEKKLVKKLHELEGHE